MKKKTQNYPIGGLNYDDESRVIPNTDLRYAKNIRNSINAANKGGSITNVLGNLQITTYLCPYNGGSFPTGTNKCIGAVEDLVNNGAVYFVWNSLGKHGIYRYRRDLTDPANPYGIVEQVIQYDFGWARSTRITSAFIVYDDPQGQESAVSGDLLYWCDPKPRKINLSKGLVVGKNKGWNIYLPQTVNLTPTTNFYFKGFAGNTIFSIGIILSAPTNRQQIITDIDAQINASANCPVVSESCDCKLVLREKTSGTVWTVETDSQQIIVSAENWYGADLIERFFDRCKWQPLQAPVGTFLQDLNYEPNYVKEKVFQFRLEYIYDDREQSALGVWSQIPINNLTCGGSSSLSLNYINVNFNDTLIPLSTTLVLLKNIRFIARELNTGKDRSVIDLSPCDFLDYDQTNNEWVCRFNFYNDIISSPIDDATAAKLFDDVPLTSGAEVFKENRIIEGDCLTGYNPPDCIDAKAQIDFGDNPNPKLWEVTFYVRVMTYGLGDSEQQGGGYTFYQMFPDSKYPFTYPNYNIVRGGIFHDITRTENDYPFFGGGGFGAGAGGDFGIRSGMEDVYDQRIPEGGFPVYLAGTPYFGISRQNDVGLPVDSFGALDTSTDGRKDAIGQYLYDGNDLYSKVTLLVPDGEYVARVASNWCSFGDKLGKGFNYDLSSGTSFQKTSANVWGIVPAGQDPLTQFEAKKEIKFTVNGANIDHAGTFIIADLAPPFDAVIGGDQTDWWQPICGYLYDSFGSTDVNGDGYNGVSVERAIVFYSALDALPSTNPNWTLKWQECCTTDHNGYFFGIRGIAANYGQFYIRAHSINGEVIANTTLINIGTVSNLFEKTLQQYNTSGASYLPAPYDLGLVICVISTDNSSARGNCSTFIEGSVLDVNTSLPLSNVSVVYETGRVDSTDVDGGYDILAWGDMITPNLGNFPVGASNITNGTERIVDNLIFSLGVSCSPIYPNGQEYFPVLITPIGSNGGDYNPSNPCIVVTWEVNEQNNPSAKAHKRGGNYTYGLRLYDVAGRLCSVVKGVEIYLPFITEDLGKYSIEDFNGAIYPPNTYKYGKPRIRLVLDSATTFPSWVSTMQWMRTKNSIYGRYLQWVANQVTYLSAVATDTTPEIETSFQNADATAIKISIKNIIDYSSQNPDSQVGYVYQTGDRVRLMYDRALNPIDGLNDFEITSYDSTPETQSIIIKQDGFNQEILSGSLFEIFNPKSVATEDEQIYYEVGEVINVTNGIPETYSLELTNGDTYWRGRLITVNDEETKFASAYPVVIEDASVSDFYPSESQDIGRIGVVDDNFRQVRRPMLLKASNQYIPSTAVNGLSSFEALNEKELDRANGVIKRLVSINQTVVAISNVRETSNYIQVVTLQQATEGNGVIAVSDQYFGTQYPHAKTLGTDLPASVFINDGTIFGFHAGRSDVWLYRGDGEVAISDVKMKNYFQRLGGEGVSDAVGVYDRFHEEYILTVWRNVVYRTRIDSYTSVSRESITFTFVFEEGQPLPQVGAEIEFQYLLNNVWYSVAGTVLSVTGNQVVIRTAYFNSPEVGMRCDITYSLPETISWFNGNDDVSKKRWITFYDFTPENYCQMGSEIISFKDGKIWIHDKNETRNNFYGVQYKSQITVIPNEQPDVTKTWYSLYLETEQDGAFAWSVPVVRNNNNQLSRILVNIFKKREEYWFAEIQKDLNTAGVQFPIINGRPLRSSSLELQMENNSTESVTLRSIICDYEESPRQ